MQTLTLASSADACDDARVAFEALYERYQRLVYAVSRRMLGDTASAEDVAQSIFLTLWTSPHSFRSGSFDAWLTTVTKNRSRDVLRKRIAIREVEYPAELRAPASLDDEVYTRLEMNRVRAALAQLPRHQRSLIELGFLGDRSHVEIAELTGLPMGTVKTRIRAGLQTLRHALCKQGEAPPANAKSSLSAG